MDTKWISVKTMLPPNGQKVMTKIDDEKGLRNIQELSRSNNLWFADGMYVYYTPTHWMPKQ